MQRSWKDRFGFGVLFEPDLFRPGGRLARLLHRFPFAFLCVFAIAGVLIDARGFESLSKSISLWGLLAFVASILPWIVELAARRRPDGSEDSAARKAGPLRLISTAILFTCAFGCLHAWSEHSFRSATILRLVDRAEEKPVVLQGILSDPVTLRQNPMAMGGSRQPVAPLQSQLTVSVSHYRGASGLERASGTVLVYSDGDLSGYLPGDRLEIYGWLKSIEGPTNPGEPDLRPSYRRRGIHARIETKNALAIKRIDKSNQTLQSAIASIANRGRESLLRHTDQTTGGLALALVLGQREFVDPATRDALLATGTAHLLSVSGMHLAILVLVATWIISAIGLRPTARFIVIVAISALYVAVTGGRPPVLRAAILISILVLSTCFRRTSQPINTLSVAAVTLILINPMNVFAVGVHLSFLAVITLMLAGRPIAPGSLQNELELQRAAGFQSLIDASSSPWIRTAKTIGRFFRQMAWLSACVTAISLPLIWSQFHLVSFISVLTNVLVWAGLMIALPMGVLTVLLDPIHSSLGIVPGVACHYALEYMWWVICWTAKLRGGHLWLPAPPGFLVACFYVVMACTLPWKSRSARWFRCGWFIVWSMVAYGFATHIRALPDETWEATFVDVGHGTSVILRGPDERVWLYDCGRLGNHLGRSRGIDTALWSLGITHIDGVFLSHADADHFNAFPAIAERFSIDTVFVPPGMMDRREGSLIKVQTAIRRHQIPIRECAADQRVGGVGVSSMAVLHPPQSGVAGSDNANSLVLRIDVGGKTLLLPGDLEPPGTQMLASTERPPGGGVLMAPHHGSLSMDAETVLAWARPWETIVSGGRRASRLEVEQMLSATGSRVHVTSRVGAIRVRLSHDGSIEVRSWLRQPW